MMFEQFLRRGMTVISERSIEQTELIGSENNENRTVNNYEDISAVSPPKN